MYACENWTTKKAEHQWIDAFELWCWRRLLKVPYTGGDPASLPWRKSVLNIHWKDWCWSWNSNTLATWCKELTHLKRPWCWERLEAGGEGDDRGWDGWMASSTQWRWVWVNFRSWQWTGKPDMLQSMGSQRAGHDWVTELNWTKVCGKTYQSSEHESPTTVPHLMSMSYIQESICSSSHWAGSEEAVKYHWREWVHFPITDGTPAPHLKTV